MHKIRALIIPCLLLSLWSSQADAGSQSTEQLIQWDGPSSGVARPSTDSFALEHFEIPLSALQHNVAERIAPALKGALLFERDGQSYLRWIIYPDDRRGGFAPGAHATPYPDRKQHLASGDCQSSDAQTGCRGDAAAGACGTARTDDDGAYPVDGGIGRRYSESGECAAAPVRSVAQGRGSELRSRLFRADRCSASSCSVALPLG